MSYVGVKINLPAQEPVKNAFEQAAELRASHDPEVKEKSRRGFAALSSEERKAMAARGGRAAHASGKASKFDSEKARVAALKSWENRRVRGEA